MSGEPYTWSDGEFLHVWSENGIDGWKDMESYASRHMASGVQLAEAHADEFAIMRIVELVALGQLSETIERALSVWGENFEVAALRKLSPELVTVYGALAQQVVAADRREDAPPAER